MKIKDHFLTQEIFEIKETEISGIWKTSPIPENLDKYYESKEYISHHQDSGGFKEKIYKLLQGFNLNYKYNILSKLLHKNANVLDFGCGAGEFLKHIEEDFTTFGYEPNNDAKKSATKKTNKTRFISDIREVENESLDAITMWHVLEHIENRDEMLELFISKLKKNGKLIIAVPNPNSHDGKKYKEFWAAYDVPRHIWHFTKSGMENLISQKNWKVEKIKPLLLDAYYISILSEKIQKKSAFLVFWKHSRSNF